MTIRFRLPMQWRYGSLPRWRRLYRQSWWSRLLCCVEEVPEGTYVKSIASSSLSVTSSEWHCCLRQPSGDKTPDAHRSVSPPEVIGTEIVEKPCPCGGFLVTSQLPGNEPGEVRNIDTVHERVVHWWWVYRLSFRNSLLQRMFFTSSWYSCETSSDTVISIGNHLLSFVYNFIMTIMEKNAIKFIFFL